MNDEKVVAILSEIRNWTRASSFASVKQLLKEALPDMKSRKAYQMMDGKCSTDNVRTACKMSPNDVIAMAQRCTAMGLMESRDDKKRVRLFDLTDFGLLKASGATSNRGHES